MAETNERLQVLSEEFSKLQQELQSTISSHQTVETQKTENQGVKEQFEKMKSDDIIYKVVGPVLLKQETSDALSTVNGRLTFIDKETKRLDQQVHEIQDKLEQVKSEILQLQAGTGNVPTSTVAKPPLMA